MGGLFQSRLGEANQIPVFGSLNHVSRTCCSMHVAGFNVDLVRVFSSVLAERGSCSGLCLREGAEA